MWSHSESENTFKDMLVGNAVLAITKIPVYTNDITLMISRCEYLIISLVYNFISLTIKTKYRLDIKGSLFSGSIVLLPGYNGIYWFSF